MANLRLAYFDINQKALQISATQEFDSIRRLDNALMPPKSAYAQMASVTNGPVRIEMDLGDDNHTETADSIVVQKFDRLAADGVDGVQVRGGGYTYKSIKELLRGRVAAWYDGSNGATAGSGTGTVQTWTDLSGVLGDATQASASMRPLVSRCDNKENTITYSADLMQATWVKSAVSVTGDTTNNPITASQTADAITEDTSTGVHKITQTGFRIDEGRTYRVSGYFHSTTRSVKLSVTGTGFSAHNVKINLSAGTTSTTGAVSNVTVETLTSTGLTWYRLSYEVTASASSGADVFEVQLTEVGGTESYTGDGSSGITAFGLQLQDAEADSDHVMTQSYRQYRGLSGLQCVVFEPQHHMFTPSTSAPAQPFTIVCACSAYPSDSGSIYDSWVFDGLDVAKRVILHRDLGDRNWKYASDTEVDSGFDSSDPVVFTLTFDSPSSEFRANGSVQSSGDTTGTKDFLGLTLGANYLTQSGSGLIKLGELIVIEGTLSSAEKLQVEEYMAAKWTRSANLASSNWQFNRSGGMLDNFPADDLIITSSETSAYNCWSVIYSTVPGAAVTRYQSSGFLLGKLFDFGVNPSNGAGMSFSPLDNPVFIASSGASYYYRSTLEKRTFSMRWEGVTDARVAELDSEILRYAHRNYVILFAEDDNDLLGGEVLVAAKIVNATIAGDSDISDWNTVTINFEEVIG